MLSIEPWKVEDFIAHHNDNLDLFWSLFKSRDLGNPGNIKCPACRDGNQRDKTFKLKFGCDRTGDFRCIRCGHTGDIVDLEAIIRWNPVDGSLDRDVAMWAIANTYRIEPRVQLGIYRHYKSDDKEYHLIAVGRDHEDGGPWRVSYRALYGKKPQPLEHRTLQEFFGMVDGKPRFQFVRHHY